MCMRGHGWPGCEGEAGMLVPCLRRWLLRKTSLATFTWMLPESTPRAPPQQPRHGPWASAVGPTLLLSTDLATGIRVSSPGGCWSLPGRSPAGTAQGPLLNRDEVRGPTAATPFNSISTNSLLSPRPQCRPEGVGLEV